MQSNCDMNGFKIEASSFNAGELITFSDTTSNGYDWEWNFGDGSKVSYLSKVGHAFEKEGVYNVKLEVNGNCSAVKTVTIASKKQEVDESLMPNFSAPQTIVEGKQVQFRDLTPNAKSWEWRFGDSGNYAVDATDKNPTYTFKTSGKKMVTLVVNGDINHVKKLDVYVQKAQEEKQVMVVPTITVKKRGPIEKGITEEKLEGMLNGVAQNELSYRNLSRYFCKDAMPEVQLVRDGKIVSLKELDELIRAKGIKIKQITIQKDKDECVTNIAINYRSSFF